MQGGNAQNKKRFIIVSLILILSLALPCFATVTESSGDGYSILGYVKVPDLPFSLDDHPYYIICYYQNTNNLFVFFGDVQPTFDSSSLPNGVMFSYARPSYYRYYLTDSGEFTDGWVGPYTHDSSEIVYPVLYSNSNIYRRNDGSLYFAASDPIPLDGYRVVEWDGDSTGLPFNSDWGFYRVSDSVPFFIDAVAVLSNNSFPYASSHDIGSETNVQYVDFFWVANALEPNELEIENGLWFLASSSGNYCSLFAYREPETEGPTGAVTGLTITNPPSGTSDFILYAGSDLQCSAEVTGTGDFSSAVSWSISHGSIGEWYPTISETGLLHVPIGTPEQRIFVTCTSASDPTFSQTVPIYILPPAVSSVTITPSSATAAPGENIQFSAIVSGSNVQDPDVTWSVGAATSPSTRITRDGLLLIGSDETSPLLGVRATSNQDGSVYSTALVTVSVPAAVTGLTISPDDITLNRGDTQHFTATVTGTGSFDSSVTWQITSVYSAGTSISANGLLTVSEEQEYDYIIIKATCTADPSFSATAYVFVEDALSDPMTIDLSVVERLLEEIKNYLKTLQHIFDRPHYFREFNMYTGKLNETEEQITGLTFNFYRFMQNMEEYVGSIAYTFANGAEVQIREDTTEGFDWFSLFFGKNSSSKVEETDFAGVSTLVNHTRDLFDTGFGFSDFFDLLDTVPFFTSEVGSSLDTTVHTYDFRDPDPFNMSILNDREKLLEEWRNKNSD